MALLANILGLPQERRAHPRHKVYKGARAVFSAEWAGVNCIVRDVSSAGARLYCEEAALLPSRFQLVLTADREMCDVRVVWRSRNLLGVAFLSPPRPLVREVL